MSVIYQEHQYFSVSPAGHTSWFWWNHWTIQCLYIWRGFARATAQSILAGLFYCGRMNMYFTMNWVVVSGGNFLWMFMHIMYVLLSCYFEFRNVLFSIIIILIIGLICGRGYRYISPVVGPRRVFLGSARWRKGRSRGCVEVCRVFMLLYWFRFEATLFLVFPSYCFA